MHHEHHVTGSETIRDIVIGMSDGLTVPFALAAGLSGAVSSSTLVVTAGIAEIVAGSIAMGLGGYLAGRTEVDHYNSELKREYDEVERVLTGQPALTGALKVVVIGALAAGAAFMMAKLINGM
jgi:VIT1/CCC1 family predicted Fe2+/Mn2+ transporter